MLPAARERGIFDDDVYALLTRAAIGAIIGARVAYVINHFSEYHHIVDVVKVTFDRSNLKDLNPRNPARDFTLDAVELEVKNCRLLINGNVAGVGKSTRGCAGALLWFYVQDRGRFIVSLVPRAGYEFQKVGVIEDNRIEFTVNDNHYEWLSSSPILPGGGTWNLWVLHDPKYAPIFGSDPAPARNKNVIEKLNEVVSNAETDANRE